MILLISLILSWPKTTNDIYLDYDESKYDIEILAVNSESWEDSVEISWHKIRKDTEDSYYLCFTNIPYDVGRIARGLSLRSMPSRPLNKDVGADMFFGTFNRAMPFGTSINKYGAWEGSQCLRINWNNIRKSRIYFSRGENGDRGLYVANLTSGTWVETLLPETVNVNGFSPTNTADNPFLSKTKLYFEQNDGNLNFYSVNHDYTNKQALPFNSSELETQIWCDPTEQTFLFCRNHYEIWQSNASGSTQTKIISSIAKPGFASDDVNRFDAIGEPSMNDRGDICLIYVFQNGTELQWDADILLFRKK